MIVWELGKPLSELSLIDEGENKVLQRKQKGFSLIELMIAVVIMGILMAIAVPAYQDYLRRGARSAGQAYLSDLAQREELLFQDARAYSDLTADARMPSDVALRYAIPTFTITAPAAGVPASYTITMVPKPGLLATDGTLTIDSLGARKRGGTIDW